MRASLRIARLLCVSVVLLLGGCDRMAQSLYLSAYDRDIKNSTRAIEIGATADGCSCDPYDPLVALYDGVSRQYDKAWELVHKARKSKRWIAPELLERLKKDSGRSD